MAEVPQVKDFIMGGGSAVAAKSAVAPLERIKLLLQCQQVSLQIAPEKRYKGIKDCLVRIPREQGIFSFWRGNAANCIRYFPTQALNFIFLDTYKTFFNVAKYKRQENELQFLVSNLAAGASTGMTSLLFVYPLDFVRTRLALDIGKHRGKDKEFHSILHCIKSIAKRDGISGLYRGFLVTMSGVVIYRACYFGFYDTLKERLPDPRNTHLYISWAIAQTVTIFAGFVSYPWDTVRRRMMMQSGRPAKEPKLYRSTAECWAKIFRYEGIRAFWKGSMTNIIRGCGGAFVLIIYDEVRLLFRN